MIQHENEMRDFAKRVISDIDFQNFYFLIEATNNSFSGGLFKIDDNISSYHKSSIDIWEKYSDEICSKLKGKGIILIYMNNGSPDYKVFSHYNKEISNKYVFDLILYQEFEVEPDDEWHKAELKKSIKKEKIKSTLVYACYLNDTDEILHRVKKASATQLNKPFDATTPLGFCAKNDNFVAFKAILDAGADLSKTTVLKESALKYAFKNSPTIVRYIKENYPEQFINEINKQGFSIAYHTSDPGLLQLVLDAGADINCHRSNHPPLHSFAAYNNLVGIEFLLKNGADINVLNKAKQTVLDKFKNGARPEVITLMSKYGT